MSKVAKHTRQTSLTPSKITEKMALLLSQGFAKEEIKWELLGGKLFSARMPVTAMEFYDAVSIGVPKLSVDILADVMDIPMTTMAHLYCSVLWCSPDPFVPKF